MSRSFGGVWVTSRSPMRIVPELISSSPASIRSEVDFPQPDGPTSAMNSPSRISRSRPGTAGLSAPGYQRWAFSKVTVAIFLLLHQQVLPDDWMCVGRNVRRERSDTTARLRLLGLASAAGQALVDVGRVTTDL